MASTSSNNINEIKASSGSYNLATTFKFYFNNEITEEKGCLNRYLDERNQLEKKVEDRQVTLNETHHLRSFNQKAVQILRCLVETQERERKRILLLTALINDISDGIHEKERQAKLMEVHEQLSSDED